MRLYMCFYIYLFLIVMFVIDILVVYEPILNRMLD